MREYFSPKVASQYLATSQDSQSCNFSGEDPAKIIQIVLEVSIRVVVTLTWKPSVFPGTACRRVSSISHTYMDICSPSPDERYYHSPSRDDAKVAWNVDIKKRKKKAPTDGVVI